MAFFLKAGIAIPMPRQLTTWRHNFQNKNRTGIYFWKTLTRAGGRLNQTIFEARSLKVDEPRERSLWIW
jgi:hypothetical protein